MASGPAHGAWPELPLSPLTWGLLAAVGLVAVVIAALTVRGARHEDDAENAPQPLGKLVEITEAPPARHFIGDPAEPAPVDAPEATPAVVRRRGAGLVAAIAADAYIGSMPPAGAAAGEAATGVLAGAPNAGPAVTRAANDAGAEPADALRAPLPLAAAGEPQQFLALHHVDLSIDVLRRHLAEAARPMPAVWVMLLDLCRTHGREATFRDVAEQFHARFNVQAPAWNEYPPTRDHPGLEAYPRLVRELTQTWGTRECRRLLDRLLYDNRSGARRGFTINAYNDLIALRRAADAVLDTIEQDFAEESKVRVAYAEAASAADETAAPAAGATATSPLVRDLEGTLETDLRLERDGRSALEREHPAFAAALAREWGNAGLAARLCEMLARGGDGAKPLSGEAKDDVDLLRRMAQRLAEVNRFTLAVD